MSRKAGFPNSSCSIKLPDGSSQRSENCDKAEDADIVYKKRQQLITFGHSRWGFKNWSWSVTKQELDFVDFANGKFSAGVVAFVSVSIKSLGIHREDVGYATAVSTQKGSAIHNARKSSVTNALRETLLSFGGNISTQLLELIEANKIECNAEESLKQSLDTKTERNCNLSNKSSTVPNNNIEEPKNATCSNKNSNGPFRKDSSDSSGSIEADQIKMEAKSPQCQNSSTNIHTVQGTSSFHEKCPPQNNGKGRNKQDYPSAAANQGGNKPAGYAANIKAVPPVTGVPPPVVMAPPPLRPMHPPNVSYVVQRVMPPLYSVQCATPPPPPPTSLYHNAYYTEFTSWPVSYENMDRHHGNVNFNYSMPPKNFLLNNRPGVECSRSSGEADANPYVSHPVNMNGAWIKPTIFYDGFWTEQKVKKWVSEQSDKSSAADDISSLTVNVQNHMCHSKV